MKEDIDRLARLLCEESGFDPDEIVERSFCPSAGPNAFFTVLQTERSPRWMAYRGEAEQVLAARRALARYDALENENGTR